MSLPPASASPTPNPPTSPGEALTNLAATIAACTSCPLHKTRKHAVPGVGPHDALIALVGEAPGEREDESGVPFVGKSGELLDEMLGLARIPRDKLYITNVLKCFPGKGNTKFLGDDPPTCLGYLKHQIEVIKPLVVVLTGKRALQHLLLPGSGLPFDPITPYVGRHFRRRDTFGDMRFSVIYHPAFLLRNKSPSDEEMCVSTLVDAWSFIQARLAHTPPPATPLTDISTAPPPMWQSKSLFREKRTPL